MKKYFWVVCIFLVALLNLYWFWPGNLYFLNDDLLHIPLTYQGHLFQTNSVRPVHELLVRLDLLLWGKNAYGYHITALLLHLIVCFQLYDLCLLVQIKWLKLDQVQAKQAAFLAVFLFLVYPQSSEALAWIIGRAPVLSAVFIMITIRIFFIKNFEWWIYCLGAFFFAAALFTYEQSILIPVAFFLIAYGEKEKVKRTEMLTYSFVLFLVDIGYIIVRKLMTSEVVGAYEGENLLTFNWRVLTANTFRLFFRLVLNPANKIVFIIGAVCFILIAGLIIFWSKKLVLNNRIVVLFGAMVFLLIAPVISLGTAVNSFESGRYLYLPSIFFVSAISIAATDAFYKYNRKRVFLSVLLILLTAYWLTGKFTASKNYADASIYAERIEDRVQQHFKTSSDTLYIDTLRVSIDRLPVFRLGFKTGINWLNNNIDTAKIVVRYYDDEVSRKDLK